MGRRFRRSVTASFQSTQAAQLRSDALLGELMTQVYQNRCDTCLSLPPVRSGNGLRAERQTSSGGVSVDPAVEFDGRRSRWQLHRDTPIANARRQLDSAQAE